MKYSQRFLLLFSGILFLLFCGCSTTTRVMVRAWAEEDYRANLVEGELPEPEHYMLVRGSYDSGYVRDDSLLGAKNFREVSSFLIDALRTQNYILAKPSDSIDLLIVAHWGQTAIDTELIYFETESADGSIEEQEHEQITEESLWKNSLILGTSSDIYSSGGSESDRSSAITNTSDERYYFALIAYDAHDLAINKKKTVKWVTRFSVDIAGKNYLDALPAMTRVAQDYLGKNVEDIRFKKTELGDAEVEFGEIEVIGSEE